MFRVGDRIKIKPLEELHSMMDGLDQIQGVTIYPSMENLAERVTLITRILNGCVEVDGFFFPFQAVEKVEGLLVGDWVRIKSWKKMLKMSTYNDDMTIEFGDGSWDFVPTTKPLCGLIARIRSIEGDTVELEGNPIIERKLERVQRRFLSKMLERVDAPF